MAGPAAPVAYCGMNPPACAAAGKAVVGATIFIGRAILAGSAGILAGTGIIEMANDADEGAKELPNEKVDTACASCGDNGDGEDPCQKAANAINDTLNGRTNYKSIKQRYAELLDNKHSQPWFWSDANSGVLRPSGSDRWGHVEQLLNQQNRLAKAQQSYYQNNCRTLSPKVLKEAAEWTMKDLLP